jgi:SPP1 family predicted phage head-tail adaptor
MNIGLFKQRITLEESTNSSDNYGGFTQTWETKRECWGKIVPLEGKEFIEALKLTTTVTHTIYIRKYDEVKPSWRVKYNNRYFDIKHVFTIKEKGVYTKMFCEEIISE